MYLLNGESKHAIDIADRGFQYGDGLFETIEVLNGIPVFLSQHLHRLFQGCHRLLIPAPDKEMLIKEAFLLAHESPRAVLKLIITRGCGGRGYRQPETIIATRLFSLHPFPDYSDSYQQQGISAKYCHHRLGINPGLAGIKHMNRLEQIIARAEWNSPAIQEGLMMDVNGNVIEGTMSNVFLVKENSLYTPCVKQCGVEGVIRNIVILIAKKNKMHVVEKNINKEELYAADELFLTNSIIGIWPIKQLEMQRYKKGSLTTRLQSLLLEFKQQELNHG